MGGHGLSAAADGSSGVRRFSVRMCGVRNLDGRKSGVRKSGVCVRAGLHIAGVCVRVVGVNACIASATVRIDVPSVRIPGVIAGNRTWCAGRITHH